MIHTLLLCVENCWHELEYVKNRREYNMADGTNHKRVGSKIIDERYYFIW